MNNYDRYFAVSAKWRDFIEAINAILVLSRTAKSGALIYELQALRPGYSTQEKQQLLAWESAVAKDERRAVQVLYRDYLVVKAELETLLAAE